MICPRTSIGNASPPSIKGRSRPWAASRAVYSTPVMRTRSPADSDSTSASESGGTTSLVPSARTATVTPDLRQGRPHMPRPSQHDLLVPVGVALDGHRHRQARDVARVREDVDAERGGVAAVPLRADAEPVGAVEHV